MESPSSRPCANFYGSHIRPFLKPSVGISSWVSEVALLSSNEDLGIKSPPWALCPRWAVTLSLRTLILCDLEMWSVWSWWWALRTHVVNLLPLPLGTHLPLQPLLQPTSAVSCNLPTVLTRHRELQSEQMVLCLPKHSRSSAFTRHCNPALCSSMHRACSRRRVGGGGGCGFNPTIQRWLVDHLSSSWPGLEQSSSALLRRRGSVPLSHMNVSGAALGANPAGRWDCSRAQGRASSLTCIWAAWLVSPQAFHHQLFLTQKPPRRSV